MDNKTNDIENVLLDIFDNGRINHSEDWLNLSIKELIERVEDFKQKHTDFSEKDRRKKAIVVDGLLINALLTYITSMPLHNRSASHSKEILK